MKSSVIGDGKLLVDFVHRVDVPGKLKKYPLVVHGGPFRLAPQHDKGIVLVKAAREVFLPSDLHIDIEDYNIPTQVEMENLVASMLFMATGYGFTNFYVGCFGGIGRTGLVMACLVKTVLAESGSVTNDSKKRIPTPVIIVREQYKPHAVETEQQLKFVRDFECFNALQLHGTIEKILD